MLLIINIFPFYNQREGSTSINSARVNLPFSLYGTVQSKIVLHAIPWSFIPGEQEGALDGSSGWHLTPGIVIISASPWNLVFIAHSTSFISKQSTSSSTRNTCFSSLNAENASRAACRCLPSSLADNFLNWSTAIYFPPPAEQQYTF